MSPPLEPASKSTAAAISLALIVGGGRGLRLGAGQPKQFLPLAGKEIIAHTLECFARHEEIDALLVG